MANNIINLVILQALLIYIALSSAQWSNFQFKCLSNDGRTPGILDYISKFGGLAPPIPTAVDVSALQCASLCIQTRLNACQSYSYDPDTRNCFTRNITLYQTGILCGIRIDQSRLRCQQSGDTFIAYAGPDQTMAECICGIRATDWTDQPDDPTFTVCIGVCQNQYPCAVNMGTTRNCVLCTWAPSACSSTAVVDSKIRLVCMPIPW